MAVLFDGANGEWLRVDDGTYLNGLTSMSVSQWIRCDGTINESGGTGFDIGWIKGEQPDNGDSGGITIRYDDLGASTSRDNTIKWRIEGLMGTQEAAALIQTNDWQHIVVTGIQGGTAKLYINGVQDPFTQSVAGSAVTTSNIALYIGTGTKGDIAGSGWEGALDDLRIYNRELSASEVETIYNLRGRDRILNGLISRYTFTEKSAGSVVTTGDVKDLTTDHDIDTVGDTPHYEPSIISVR